MVKYHHLLILYSFNSKKIPGREANWNLVFTHSGRYFFHNSITNQRSWLPPNELLNSINEHFTPTRKLEFFDNSINDERDDDNLIDEEEESDDEENDDSESDDNESSSDTSDSNDNESCNNNVPNASSIDAEDEFKLYLLKQFINPFDPWSLISSQHASSPQFQAIPSDKRRQDLFAQTCPVLISMRRERSLEAQNWWKQILKESSDNRLTWPQVLNGKLKQNQRLFSLLNEKECEKEFKGSLMKKN
jgi:hypothetical protein